MTDAPTQEQVERIVAGLTKAQRAMVLTDSSHFHQDHHGKWNAKTWKVSSAVKDLGLTEGYGTLSRPTPLGLAVRAHLTKGSDQ